MFINITNNFHEKDIEKFSLVSSFCYLPIFFPFGYLLGFVSKLGRFHIKQSSLLHFINFILLLFIYIFRNNIIIAIPFFLLYIFFSIISFYIFINNLNKKILKVNIR